MNSAAISPELYPIRLIVGAILTPFLRYYLDLELQRRGVKHNAIIAFETQIQWLEHVRGQDASFVKKYDESLEALWPSLQATLPAVKWSTRQSIQEEWHRYANADPSRYPSIDEFGMHIDRVLSVNPIPTAEGRVFSPLQAIVALLKSG